MSQDWYALQIALAPCLLGYGEIAKRLHADSKTKREGNIYWKWIENYVADDYVEAVNVGRGKSLPRLVSYTTLTLPALLERNAVLQSPSRIEELVQIFIHATNVRITCPRKEENFRADLRIDGDWILDDGCWSWGVEMTNDVNDIDDESTMM